MINFYLNKFNHKCLDFTFRVGIFYQHWKVEKHWKKPTYTKGNTFRELDFGKISIFLGRTR